MDPLGSPASLPRDPHNGVLKLARLLFTIEHGLIEYYNKPDEESEERLANTRGPDDGHLKYGRRLAEVNWLLHVMMGLRSL